jgi:NAD(P)-dependent dehydrogenase (short-subunit alcohol dehydrogenase family)
MGTGSGHHISLEGKKIIVVGATAGIGKEAALDFGTMGADVVFVGRSEVKMAEVLAAAGSGHGVLADISDPDQIEPMMAEAIDYLGGPVDLLLSSVGVSRLGRIKDAPADLWQECMATNVVGPALLTKAVIPHLRPGALVGHLSSEIVGRPYPGLVPYATSKAALEEVIRGARAEHPEFRFVCIRVGATGDTEFSRDFDQALAADLSGLWIERGVIPNNLMTAADLGQAIARICAIAIEYDDIDYHDVDLRGTGGPFYGTIDKLMEQMADVQAEGHR